MEWYGIWPEAAMASNTFEEQRFIPECEVIYEGGSTLEELYHDCKKNPGHLTFTPLTNLKLEHLPAHCQTQEYMDCILSKWDLTVKIIVKYVSPKRPDTYPNSNVPYPYSAIKGSKRKTRFGTGLIDTHSDVDFGYGLCPCHLCNTSENPKTGLYLKIRIMTATHVIYDELEASKAVFECFYDSEDRQGVKCLYGVKVINDDESLRHDSDRCLIECVTHEYDLRQTLEIAISQSRYVDDLIQVDKLNTSNAFMISHPHGMSKRISFGNILHYNIYKDGKFLPDLPYTFEHGTKCCLPPTPRFKSSCLSSDNGIEEKKSVLTKFKMFLNLKNNIHDVPCQDGMILIESGKEYIIPKGTTFTLPIDSNDWAYQLNFLQTSRFSFPQNTIFTLPNGREVFFPGKTEFYSNAEFDDILTEAMFILNYLTYDISTCPGSSGAGILFLGVPPKGNIHLHAGEANRGAESKDINQSGLVRLLEKLPKTLLPWYNVPYIDYEWI